jgi:hypothetical protein
VKTRARRWEGIFGGVLLDLFLIVLLIGILIIGLVVGWVVWRQGGGVLKRWDRVVEALPAAFRSRAVRGAVAVDLDISGRSAWIQGRTRDLLSRRGVGEKFIVTTYNVERREGGVLWLEDTLVVRRPPGFDEKVFLRELVPLLAEKGLVVMDDLREGGTWTLSLGDRKRVYQHVVFDGVPSPRRSS